jgi:transposase
MSAKNHTPPQDDWIAGFTIPEVAKRLRVGQDRVRRWIKRGDLAACNTADAKCRRPRYVVLPKQLAAFVRRRSAAEPQPTPRWKNRTTEGDYFPDW